MFLIAITAKNHCFAYSFWLRLASRSNPFYYIAKWMHFRLSRKYGIQISPKMKLGCGFYIGSNVCIVEDVHIGNNVTIGTELWL